MSDDFAMMFERRAVNDLMADLTPMDPEETSGAMEQMESTPLTEDQLKAWPPFAAHSKNLYALYEGEAFRGTDDEAAVYGIETMGEFAHNFAGNEGTLHQAAQIAMSKSSDYAKSFVYLAQQYERLPTFSMKGFGRFVGGILRDPLTYAGLGVGAMGFKAIGQPAKAGIRGAITELAKKAALAPKTSAAISGGTLVGGGNVAQQSIEAEAGMEKPMAERATEAALSTALGAAGGAGLVKGGELAVKGGKSLYEKVSSALDGIDITPDDRAAIDDVIKSLDPVQQPPAQQAAPIEPRGPAFDQPAPVIDGFQNSIFENPITVGSAANHEGSHVAEVGYAYRSIGDAELQAIRNDGFALPPPGGKSKGGRKNVKHWSRADGKLYYRPDQIVIRIRSENLDPSTPASSKNIEVWNKDTGSFEPVSPDIAGKAQQAAPIEPRGPAVKLTPAENKFFAEFMENEVNREELMEAVPSLRIDNGTISVDQKGVDELFRWIDEIVVLDGAGKVPPRLKKAKFYNMLDGAKFYNMPDGETN
jgi:hypothetical protein